MDLIQGNRSPEFDIDSLVYGLLLLPALIADTLRVPIGAVIKGTMLQEYPGVSLYC